MSSLPETERRRTRSRREILFASATVGAGFILNACLPEEQPHRSELLSFLELVSKKGGYLYLEPSGQTIGFIDESGQKLSLPKDPTINRYYSLGLSPKGDQLALVFSKKEDKNHAYLRLVDLTKRKVVDLRENVDIVGNEEPKNPNLWTPRWSPDQSLIFSPAHQAVWDTNSPRCVIEDINAESTHFDLSEKWSPANNELITWNKTKGNGVFISGPQKDIQLELPSRFPETAAWVNNGELVVVQTGDNPARFNYFDRLGKLVKGKEVVLDRELSPKTVVFSPDGQFVAAANNDNTALFVKNLDAGKTLWVPFYLQQEVSKQRPDLSTGQNLGWLKNGKLFLLFPFIDKSVFECTVFSIAEFFQQGGTDYPKMIYSALKTIDLVGFEPGDSISAINRNDAYQQERLVVEIRNNNGQIKNTLVVDFKTGVVKNLGKVANVVFWPGARSIIPDSPRIAIKEPEKKKEIPASNGDLVVVDNECYYLNNGRKYRVSKDKFIANSGYPRPPVIVSRDFLKDFPDGEIAEEPYIIDYAGKLRKNNKSGGQKNIWVPGWLTHTKGVFYPGITADFDVNLDETFQEYRQNLENLGWTSLDNLFYTYDKKRNWLGYRRRDTIQDPEESITLFDEELAEFGRAFPLDRLNIFYHSLGGVVGLHGCLSHLPFINRMVFFDSPLKGIPHDWRSNVLQRVTPFFGDKVLKYLYDAWETKSYQQRVDEIIEEILGHGVEIYTFGSTDDLVVPWQSAVHNGSKDTIGNKKIRLAFPMGRNIFSFPPDLGHCQVLDHEEIKGDVAAMTGKNKAAG